ncbi:MAG: N-acetyltransferase [Ardenticatenia bacterium]|jgi:ribosomal protein S18 acetylase RimI-like enzyme|nr:MAG: N-acetyltransferase [Ardenticatenia bacterium]
MIEIYAARPGDGPGILELASRIDIFNSAEKACVQELWNEYLSKQTASDYNFLVCRDSERVLGFACYGPHPLTRSAYDLHWIAVHPEVQGKGIGRALLECVEAGVQIAGGTLLVIETSGTPDYQATRRFYEACGYQCQAIIHDFYADGDDLVIFAKYLNGHSTAVRPAQHAA